MPPSDEVLITVISTFGVVIAALLGYLGIVATGARRHAKAARHQVQNSHEVNLRDDLDEKFKGLADLVKQVIKDQGGMKADIRQIRHDQSEDREALAIERERIRSLEDTTPARKRTTKPKENHE